MGLGWDGDCVISIPDVQIGPSRAQLIPIHFPSCNLSAITGITMLLQTSLHTTRHSHCSTLQGENLNEPINFHSVLKFMSCSMQILTDTEEDLLSKLLLSSELQSLSIDA